MTNDRTLKQYIDRIQSRESQDTSEAHINIMLASLLGSDHLIDMWWNSPNKGFGGKSPHEVYHTDDQGKRAVYDYVSHYLGDDYL